MERLPTEQALTARTREFVALRTDPSRATEENT